MTRRSPFAAACSPFIAALIVAALILIGGGTRAENIVFPADAGVVDVTQAPYSVRGDGRTDATSGLQRALDDAKGNARKIIYLPNGVYRVSATLHWPEAPNTYGYVNVQGQSRRGTVLALADGVFKDPGRPSPVLTCGRHGSADWFANSLRNLTVDTGRGNRGAIGVQFFSNNMGCLRDVAIRSGDGAGVIGLDLGYNDMNGPLLVKNLAVSGFDVGISCGGAVNSQTMEHVSLSGQNVVGLRNTGQCLSVRDLRSVGAAPAVENSGAGLLALLGAALPGGPAAIRNTGALFARDPAAASHPPLSLFPARAFALPIRETPDVPWDDPAQWVSPAKFGGLPNDDKDDTRAIQAAIDSGATTVYFPNGNYKISSTVFVRGKVRRIIGCEATIEVPDMGGKPGFRVVDGAAPVVVFERLGSGYSRATTLENASRRTLVVRDCINVCGAMTGPGDVFLEDVCANPFTHWRFGRQNVWARQLNVEDEGDHVVNDGGRLWILGLKTERGGTLIETAHGGRTELDGGFCYTTTAGGLAPMFTVTDAAAVLTIGESCFNGDPYTRLVRETQGGVTRTLKRSDAPGRTNGSLIVRYLGGK